MKYPGFAIISRPDLKTTKIFSPSLELHGLIRPLSTLDTFAHLLA